MLTLAKSSEDRLSRIAQTNPPHGSKSLIDGA